MKVIEFGCAGKKIAIVGSIHGNETIGNRVIGRLARENIAGARIKAIIANEEAIKAGRRFIDVDGNRCFPGKKDGNTEQRIAFEVLRELNGYRYVIDIHSTYADMHDTIIITKKGALGLAGMVPLKNLAIMNRRIAKGGAINDYFPSCVSIEFNRKKSTEHVLRIVRSTICNLINGRKSRIKKETYLVNSVLSSAGRPARIKNYGLVKRGTVIAVDGRRKIISKDDFYPLFLGEKGYRGTLCMQAVKLK